MRETICSHLKQLIGLCAILAMLSCFSRADGQEEDRSITIGTRIVLHSEVLDKDMELSVHLPNSYSDTSKRYPVLCTFQTHFEQTAGAVKNLYDYSLIPEMIVIRIDNYEFGYLTPVEVDDDPNTGKADDFLRFFKEELFAHIDRNYRTQPYRIVFSNSWGGMFCAYAVLAKPDVFNAAIASVPWVIFDGEKRFMIKNAERFLDAGKYHGHFLYMAADNETELFPDLQVFVDILRDNPKEGLDWEFHHWPEEDHYSTGQRAVYWGLRALYAPWSSIPEEVAAGGLESVKSYESSLTDRYGYEIGISYSAIRIAAQNIKNAGDYDKAIDLYNYAVAKRPDDAFAWVSLGRAYEDSGQIDLARATYETAYRIAVENSDSQVKWVKSFLDRLSDSSATEESDD
jgi:predicted alpha/beta superfamily hydrolase